MGRDQEWGCSVLLTGGGLIEANFQAFDETKHERIKGISIYVHCAH
jgi:hypothetical protein